MPPFEMAGRCKPEHSKALTTIGADKDYDNGQILFDLEQRKIKPHIAITSKAPANPETSPKKRRPRIRARLRMKVSQKTVEYSIGQRVRKNAE